MWVNHQLLVCTQIKQPAGSVVWARGEGVAIGEELQTQSRGDLQADSFTEEALERDMKFSRGVCVCVAVLTQIALMSDSCPVNVCRHIPSLMSQSFAEASQAPETNSLVSGARERLMTSPVWPANVVVCWPVSMSHRALKGEQEASFSVRWWIWMCWFCN